MDKEFKKSINEAMKLGTRIADSLEKLVNEPLVEIHTPPPQCPHCGKINPTVRVYKMDEGQGTMAGFIIPVQCTHCKQDFYFVAVELNGQPNEGQARQLGNDIVERMING